MSKDLWHTPPQTPDVFKSHPIIVVYEAGDQVEQMDSKEYTDLVGERYVNRWCYVDDLLALETELERTRKALEMTDTDLAIIVTNLDKVFPDMRLVFETIRSARKRIAEITTLEQKDVK